MTEELLRRAAREASLSGDTGINHFHEALADLFQRVADDYQIAKHGYWSRVVENVALTFLGEEHDEATEG